MKLKSTCAWFSILLSVIVLRHHFKELGNVLRTYGIFHQYVQSHPEILYTQPAKAAIVDGRSHDSSQVVSSPLASKAERKSQDPPTPRVIHQIVLGENLSTELRAYRSGNLGCHNFHSEWTHYLWTDANATAFIDENYPSLSSVYRGYPQKIQRANILRYALLHHFGGVYLDMDIECLAPLESLMNLPFLTPGAYPAGINNAFILARPRHPFLEKALDEVATHDLYWPLPYVRNMLSTGCMFLSNQWTDFVAQLDEKSHVHAEDRVYILADENGDMRKHMLRGRVVTPLFRHGGASSWHG